MCGIAGFFAPERNLMEERDYWVGQLDNMRRVQKHRGPDDEGLYLSEHCAIAQVRLAVIDPMRGHQPLVISDGAGEICIVHNGEIYNMWELRRELEEEGVHFETQSDTEVILNGYRLQGVKFFEQLNGVFAFVIWDKRQNRIYLCRDRLGVKPLFFSFYEGMLVFASEIKGLLCLNGMRAKIGREGLCEIFALGPAKTPGKGVYEEIYEVYAGSIITAEEAGIRAVSASCFEAGGRGEGRWYCSRKAGNIALCEERYWKLKICDHTENLSQTVAHTEELVTDAVRMQMLSDIPICTLLSGGVDSSLVTAICAEELKKQGKQLDTFSFDFIGNQDYFQASTYQPSQDRPFAELMVKRCGTKHHFLECDNALLADELYEAVKARDLPGMADVEASLLYFCRKVAEYDRVTLTGECADEIFGGYPWFHREEMVLKDGFPWSNEFSMRTVMLRDEVLGQLKLKEYEAEAYEKTMREAPVNRDYSEYEQRRQKIGWLNLNWFMVTLLDRMDRTSMAAGMEARVPFADYRIVEYIYNVPWAMKCPDGMVKGLLRKAGERYLPKEVLYRKKSPYPKTYHPEYERILRERFREMLEDGSEPIHLLVDKKKALQFMKMPSDYAKPWYGQLMAGPQLFAYLLMVNYWLKEYRIQITGL